VSTGQGEVGWSVQDKKAMNLLTTQSLAVRQVTLQPGHGCAQMMRGVLVLKVQDYLAC
jgi:hypothetical protein